MATKLEQLALAKAAYEKLQEEAASEIAANKKVVMGEVLEHLKDNKITTAELIIYARVGKSKFSNDQGESWSGKGKQPAWLAEALAGGKKLEDFLTHPASAE